MRADDTKAQPTCPRCPELEEQIRVLEEQVRELGEALEKAKRAGKRQAAPFSRGKKKKDPKKPGRKKGHPGARRKNPKHVDKILKAPDLKNCSDCGGELEKKKDEVNYQSDLPPITPEVTCFHFQSGWCPGCAKRVFSRHEEQTSTATGAAAHHLGPRVLAFATDLKVRLGIPYRKIVDILWHKFGFEVTAGALAQANERLAKRAAPTVEKMKEALSEEEIVSADETGWRVSANPWWLWVVCSKLFTIYEIVPHRCATVVEEILGECFQGLLMRDGWRSYDTRLDCDMLRCLLHLKRNAQDLEDRQNGAAAEEIGFFALWLDGIFDLRGRAENLMPEQYAQEADGFIEWFDEFIAASHESDANSRFAQRLKEIRHQIVPIVNDPELPATNNLGERQVRPMVIHRKVSAGNKTEKGAKALAVLSSLAATCRQQARDFTQILRDILSCEPGEAAPFW